MKRMHYYFRVIHNKYAKYRLRKYSHLYESRPKDAIPPAWHKLWNLYWRIRKERPLKVIEFGSGCSTIIMAQALYENGIGHLYTYEESEKWKKATESSLPKHVNNVSVYHSPIREVEYDGIPGFRYTGDIGEADFVYLDGPVLRPDRKFAVDILYMKKKPKYIVVDSRKSNCDFLKKYLTGYSFTYNFLNNQSLFYKN